MGHGILLKLLTLQICLIAVMAVPPSMGRRRTWWTPRSHQSHTDFISSCELPTDRGLFKVRAYRHTVDNKTNDIAVLLYGDVEGRSAVPLRVHDQCLTSEVFGSRRCDCKGQLEMALDYISEHNGVVVYLQQEGRGIGLANKIAAYALQDDGLDTVDANLHLGFAEDERSYDAVPVILNDLNIRSVQLMTNNPRKVKQLVALGVQLDGILPIVVDPDEFNVDYLHTKARRMAHILPLHLWKELVDKRKNNKDADLLAAAQNCTTTTPMGMGTPHLDIEELRSSRKYRKGRETVVAAIEALASGYPVLVTDDTDRENEGDLIIAAELATPETVAFMIRYTSGVICVGMESRRLRHLRLPPMVSSNEDPKKTAFTVSVDATAGTTTGISASDRAHTARLLAHPQSSASDFHRPGHLFPLQAKTGGVLARPGHTEAAVDLTRLAGLQPVGLLSEVVSMRHPTEMARLDELEEFAKNHSIVMTTIEDLIVYRLDLLDAAAQEE